MLDDTAVAELVELKPKAERLLTDFPYFAEHCLRIRPKAGGLVPFRLNPVQSIVHDKIEAQREATGRVRALVLKARQPGVSTYTEGRFFWRVTQREGVSAFILTHQQQATETIFGMAQRFHENMPQPIKLRTEASNAKEMRFAGLGSDILVSTAGAKGAGRGGTVHYFHGSEVAHWQNAADHMAGVMQSVPDAPDTEVILESTANGVGGLFYDMCQAAQRGDGDYILIFIPWFEHDEYRAEPPEGWQPPPEFREYGEVHGLSLECLHWAWRKNAELAQACGGTTDEICWLFRQEYPATSAEAFQLADSESLIRGERVLRARKATVSDQSLAPLVLGVDIARGGKDKTRIVDRRGRCAGHLVDVTLDTRDLMEIVGHVGKLIAQHKPGAVFVDGTGIGAGVYDRLRELGHRNAHLVTFGGKATKADRYANKRAEMWGEMAEWFADEGGVDIPDSDEVQASLCAPGYSFDSSSRLMIEPKEKIRERLGFSPDFGDALALTFARHVVSARVQEARRAQRPTRANNSYSPLRWKR